jgi:hypothetical protein
MVTTLSAAAISLSHSAPPISWPLILVNSLSDTPRASAQGAHTYTGTSCSTIVAKSSLNGGNPIPWMALATLSIAR